MDSFGLGRSLEPERSLAQQAWRVDNQMELRRDELLIDVKIVSINLVSFSEIWEETGGDDDRRWDDACGNGLVQFCLDAEALQDSVGPARVAV